eukprot:TRINITY_DN7860_c0_g1_i3.p1 TRINITY_DN7860_c0_g1~~TRINITY_DN7860_c0_g1_i3.p1  ORF type:complete len:245 (+),score=39.88 TRINITY_DN7860_c0_g1_i3:72-806(+)
MLVRNTALVVLFIFSLAAFFYIGKYKKQLDVEHETTQQILARTRAAHRKEKKIETVCWSPRAQVFRNFVSDEECQYIMERGVSRLQRSMVVGADGMDVVSDHRSSMGAFLSFMDGDPIIVDIERRIAEWTHLPAENGETFYLLRYQPGEQYKPHVDFFGDEIDTRVSGNRIATVLVYLDEPEEGGETRFPHSDVEVKVKKGDALLFWDYTPGLEPDPTSLHQSKPVIKGVKWCMTKWIRMRRFE